MAAHVHFLLFVSRLPVSESEGGKYGGDHTADSGKQTAVVVFDCLKGAAGKAESLQGAQPLPKIWKAGIKLAFLSGLCYCLSGNGFDFPQDTAPISCG